MKNITIEQVQALLQVIYSTNISAQQFDAVRKLLTELPEVKEEPKKK